MSDFILSNTDTESKTYTDQHAEALQFRFVTRSLPTFSKSSRHISRKHISSTRLSTLNGSWTKPNYNTQRFAGPRFFQSTVSVAILCIVATAITMSTVLGLICTFAPRATSIGLRTTGIRYFAFDF